VYENRKCVIKIDVIQRKKQVKWTERKSSTHGFIVAMCQK
jgi:hypothetical protein